MSEEKAAHIGGWYVLAAACIVGFCSVFVVFLTWWLTRPGPEAKPPAAETPFLEPPATEPALAFVFPAEPIIQKVNWKSNQNGAVGDDKEKATFRFCLVNGETEPIKITSGTLRILRIDRESWEVTTLLALPRINHSGHIRVPIEDVDSGDPIPIPIARTVDRSDEFILWFDLRKWEKAVWTLEATITLNWDSGYVTSDPFEMVIHTNSEVVVIDNRPGAADVMVPELVVPQGQGVDIRVPE